MLAFIASLLFGVLVAEGKMPIPDWASQVKAQSLIQDVYGKELEAARDPKQKAALAREILAVARKEPDPANKFVGLAMARRLAVEANDGALALEVLTAQVASFASGRESAPDAMLAKADQLWAEAERKRGSERLAQRIEAVEIWMRAGKESPLLAAKWNDRIATIKSGGAIVLAAKDVRLVGARIHYDAHLGGIAGWFLPTDYPEWDARLTAGQYAAAIKYSIKDYAGRSLFALVVVRDGASKPVIQTAFRPDTTGTWETRNEFAIGTFSIRAEGTYRVRLILLNKGVPDPGVPTIVLESLLLYPL